MRYPIFGVGGVSLNPGNAGRRLITDESYLLFISLLSIALFYCHIVTSGVLAGEPGARVPLRRAFKGAPKWHWGGSYETGNSVVRSFAFASCARLQA